MDHEQDFMSRCSVFPSGLLNLKLPSMSLFYLEAKIPPSDLEMTASTIPKAGGPEWFARLYA